MTTKITKDNISLATITNTEISPSWIYQLQEK